MSRFILIKHRCFGCGCDLGFIDTIDNANYKYYAKKQRYYCKECYEERK